MPKVLIVDDFPANRLFLTSLLQHRNYELIEAADGQQALELTRATRPDLVITDLLMPKMDGYEFIRQLRSDPAVSATRVIFYSARYHKWEVNELEELVPAARHLSKPAPPEEILRTIDEVLSQASESGTVHEPGEFDRAHLRVVTDKLAQKVQVLDSLYRLSQQLARESDPAALVEKFCHSARETVGTQYAAIAILAEHGQSLRHFFISGPAPEARGATAVPPLHQALLHGLPGTEHPARFNQLPPELLHTFPESLRPVHSLLSSPVASSHRHYGIVYFCNRTDRSGFSEEDLDLARMLGSQLATAYENVRRLEDLQQARTELRRYADGLEQHVAERTARLQDTIADLERFSYSLSHDMRAPLRAMRGFSEILLHDFGPQLGDEPVAYLRRISSAAERLDQLIQDVLTYSQLARGSIALKPISVEALTMQLIDENPALQPPHAEIVIQSPLHQVLGHEASLMQVISNLIYNATKFVPHGRRPHVRLWTEAANGHVRLFVRDNGIGIPKEAHERIFGIFERFHGHEYEGTGIGLAIVRKAVERMGGQVGLESHPDEGSTFWVELRMPGL